MTPTPVFQLRMGTRRPYVPLLAVLLTGWSSAFADAPNLGPDAYFVQAGVAEHVDALTFGFVWESAWQKDLALGRLTAYWEISIGRWRSEINSTRRASAWVTQIGITPVLRWQPRSWSERWFLEAGIGANVLLPIYQSADKKFSTAFNFGDHIAIGRRIGDGSRQELMLRLQHFSNAGIKRPNPGEDFLQLRYVHRF